MGYPLYLPRSRGLRRSVRGDHGGRRLGPELEVAVAELVERALVLEEDDLAEALTAEREADADLRQLGVCYVPPLFVHATVP